MKRKICIVLLAFIAVIAGIFGLAACGGDDKEPDEGNAVHSVHSYSDWVTVTAPTCTQSGERRRTCECGAYISEELMALGHSNVSYEAKPATCYEMGWDAYEECTRGCGYSTKVERPMIPHTYENYICTVSECGHKMYEVSNGFVASFNDSNETNVAVPATLYGMPITGIAGHAFADSGVITVEIKQGITTLQATAFEDCTSLRTVEIPDSIETIGDGAFWGCENIVYNHDLATDAYYLGNSSSPSSRYLVFIKPRDPSLKEIRISSATKIVYSGAFSGCTELERVELSDNLKYGADLFVGCTSLKEVVLPSTTTEIVSSMFSGCTGLETIEIPNRVTVIGSSAFSGCTGLTDIELPNGVESIGSSAFSECTGLTEIEIPASVTSIESNAFESSGIENIVFKGSNVKSIGNHAFSGCENLKSIVLPEGLTKINSYMFQSCDNLEWIYVPNSVKSIGEEIFMGIDSTVKVYYEGTVEDWAKIDRGYGNPPINHAKIFLYSESGSTGAYDYWHWVNDLPAEW